MRISLLLQREPFGKILEKTLEQFFSNKYRTPFKVRWNPARPMHSAQIWHCNPYLNIIAVPEIHHENFAPAVLEFSRSVRPWQTPIQKLYVWFATHSPGIQWLSTEKLEVAPPIPNAQKTLIIGGNNHIRILDYENKMCHVIAKFGFKKDFIVNNIDVRKNNFFLPSPAIKEVADDFGWFSEEIVVGTPLNRLTDSTDQEKSLEMILPLLHRLYEETSQKIGVTEYAKNLIDYVNDNIHQCELIRQQEKDKLSISFHHLSNVLNRCNRASDKITTVQSHGDFQPGNILRSDQKTWLIDWEYTFRRQIAYDSLVYILRSRFPRGLSGRILLYLKGKSVSNRNSHPLYRYVNGKSNRDKIIMIGLFLLEELALRTLEISNPLLQRLEEGVKVFFEEFRNAAAAIQEIHP